MPREILYDNAKTIVLERDAYGPNHHRWHPALLDLAKSYGFIPKLCRPYRACTKGKVERFHRYLRGNFYVPLSSWLKQAGLILDVETANVEVNKWLREVANLRVHPITKHTPDQLFEACERQALGKLPLFNKPITQAMTPRWPLSTMPSPLQHPLSVYQQLLTETRI